MANQIRIMRAAAFLVCYVVGELFAKVYGGCIHDQLKNVQVVSSPQQYSSSNGYQGDDAMSPAPGSVPLAPANKDSEDEFPLHGQIHVEVNPEFFPRRAQQEREEL